jgi:pyrroline-5-carboxylate reductase
MKMSLEGKRIGFIGGGAMAEALVGGLIAAGMAPSDIAVADVAAARREHLARALGVRTSEANAAVVEEAHIAVLAVKPNVVGPVLEDLRATGRANLDAPLWISIAAGTPIARLDAHLPEGARVVRAMPNTPALVRAGATAICGNARATRDDLAAARALFDSVGITWEAPSEDLLDPVTGLSGSGPAYLFAFLEALAEAGEEVGLPAEAAARLAAQTVFGAAKLALESDRTPAELRKQVSSPGGTTLAGLARLEADGFGAAICHAVAAATRRARELGARPED